MDDGWSQIVRIKELSIKNWGRDKSRGGEETNWEEGKGYRTQSCFKMVLNLFEEKDKLREDGEEEEEEDEEEEEEEE